jgi:hypothetical protein
MMGGEENLFLFSFILLKKLFNPSLNPIHLIIFLHMSLIYKLNNKNELHEAKAALHR